jgi:hypothetical protein
LKKKKKKRKEKKEKKSQVRGTEVGHFAQIIPTDFPKEI